MKKFIAVLSAVIVLLFSCEKPLAEGESLDRDVVDGKFTGYVYNYGFCEEPNYWYQFENYQQRIDEFQIPEEALAKLTTEGLSHTCMYYPLRWDFIVWGGFSTSSYDGILSIIDNYNGLTELSKRKYGPGALLKLYENLRPDVSEARTMLYKGEISNVNSFMDRNYLELLLSTEYFTPKMSIEQLDRLSGSIVSMTNYYFENPDSHSYFPSFGYPYCALCRVLIVKSNKNIVALTDIEKSMLAFFIRWAGRVSPDDNTAILKILSDKVPGLKTPAIISV
jgi:hypothetical protein